MTFKDFLIQHGNCCHRTIKYYQKISKSYESYCTKKNLKTHALITVQDFFRFKNFSFKKYRMARISLDAIELFLIFSLRNRGLPLPPFLYQGLCLNSSLLPELRRPINLKSALSKEERIRSLWWELLRDYRKLLNFQNLKDKEINQKTKLGEHISKVFQDLNPLCISQKELQVFIEQQEQEKYPYETTMIREVFQKLFNWHCPDEIDSIQYTALEPEQIVHFIQLLPYPANLIVRLVLECGLNLNEAVQLRINNLDLQQGKIRWRRKEQTRIRSLPDELYGKIQLHIKLLEQKYFRKTSSKEHGLTKMKALFENFWLFPSTKKHEQSRTHMHPSALQRHVRQAVISASLPKGTTLQNLKTSCAYHMLKSGFDKKLVQEMFGHKNLKAIHQFSRLLPADSLNLPSPLEVLKSEADRLS
jgi:integrase